MAKAATKVAAAPKISIKELSAELERIKARVDALSAMRELFDTRFGQLSEKIGEVRSLALGAERELGEARKKSEQALALVEQIKPEVFLSEMKRREAEISLLRGRIETLETQLKDFRRELAEFQKIVTTFRGLKGIDELSREVSRELMEMKKTKMEVERHADKVATMFFEVQRGLRDFAKLNLTLERLDETVRSLMKSVSGLEVKIGEFATKKELGEALQAFEAVKSLPHVEELTKKLEELGPRLEKLEEVKAEGYGELEKRVAALENTLKGLDVEGFSKKAEEAGKVLEKVEALLSRVDEIEQRASKLDELEKKLKSVEKISIPKEVERVSEVFDRLDSISSLLKALDERMVEKSDLERLEERVSTLEERIEKLPEGGGKGGEEIEERLKPLEEKIEKLSKLEQKMAEAMLALDKRVESLESKLGKPTKRAEETPTRKPLKKSK
jgi:chromosome segregation ATPase